MNEKRIPLTSAEISILWTAYMNDSMANCMLGFMLKHIEDGEIKSVVQFAYDISSDCLQQLGTIFQQEKFARPDGFNETDVNEEAPRLFTDIFCLTYVSHMGKTGMLTYSGALAMSVRKDIRDHFTQVLDRTTELYNLSIDVSSSKGTNARPPYIEVPKEVKYVNDKNYLSGINPLHEKRPLNAVEISYLYQNIATNSMGIKLCTAFSQTAVKKEVTDYMLRTKEVSKKHIQLFSEVLLKEDIQVPGIPDVGVSNSTTQTFSDKFAMFHKSLIVGAGIGNYATAASLSQRTDLIVNYERLSLEVAKVAKSGIDIMITNNWLEEPPGTKNRVKLAKSKDKSSF